METCVSFFTACSAVNLFETNTHSYFSMKFRVLGIVYLDRLTGAHPTHTYGITRLMLCMVGSHQYVRTLGNVGEVRKVWLVLL